MWSLMGMDIEKINNAQHWNLSNILYIRLTETVFGIFCKFKFSAFLQFRFKDS